MRYDYVFETAVGDRLWTKVQGLAGGNERGKESTPGLASAHVVEKPAVSSPSSVGGLNLEPDDAINGILMFYLTYVLNINSTQ